jgi:hypothetical protein
VLLSSGLAYRGRVQHVRGLVPGGRERNHQGALAAAAFELDALGYHPSDEASADAAAVAGGLGSVLQRALATARVGRMMKLKITFNFIMRQPTCCADTLSTDETSQIPPPPSAPRGSA